MVEYVTYKTRFYSAEQFPPWKSGLHKLYAIRASASGAENTDGYNVM